jgi:hypothetical protein
MSTFEIKLDGSLTRLFLSTLEKTLLALGFNKGEEIRSPDAPDLTEYLQEGFRVVVTNAEEGDFHKIQISSRDGDVLPLVEKSVKALLTHIVNLFAERGLKELERVRDCISMD